MFFFIIYYSYIAARSLSDNFINNINFSQLGANTKKIKNFHVLIHFI